MIQPRNRSTGQFEEHSHSRPEVALRSDPLAEWTASERRIILRSLRNMSEVFDDILVIAGEGAEAFYAPNHILRNAAVGALIRLGEQARQLPKSFVAAEPHVRFADMVGMRNILAHKFKKVSWQTVWTTVVLCETEYATVHEQVLRAYDPSRTGCVPAPR